MKTFKIISAILLFISADVFSQSWESVSLGNNVTSTDLSFVNENTGFALTNYGINRKRLYKSSDKGLTWVSVWEKDENLAFPSASVFFKSAYEGYVCYQNKISKLTFSTDNSVSEQTVFTFPENSYKHKIKFVKDPQTGNFNIGYALFSKNSGPGVSIYKTTNGGTSWFITNVDNFFSDTPLYISRLMDIDFDKTNNGNVWAVGSATNNNPFYTYYIVINTTDGFNQNYNIHSVHNPQHVNNQLNYVSCLPNSEVRMLGYDGIYNQNYQKIYSYGGQSFGLNFVDGNLGFAAFGNGKLMKTLNGGINWTEEATIATGSGADQISAIKTFGNIAYYADPVTDKIYTRKLQMNLYTKDETSQLVTGINFDKPFDPNNTHSTPGSDYLRGGFSSLRAPQVLGTGNSEKIFYKWNDNSLISSMINYYFNSPGTIQANYKSKQYSTIPSAISNPNSTKAYKDKVINGVNLIHQVHESMGGIFYSKSTNNGATFQTEDVVNRFFANQNASGNKNVSLDIIKDYTTTDPVTVRDNGSNNVGQKNVVAAWEYHDGTNTQIKVANRVSNIMQTGYEWNFYGQNSLDYSYAKFASSSNYESKPKIFAAANNYTTLDDSRTFYIAVPHLEPSTNNGNKIVVSATYSNYSLNSVVDDGDITDFSVTAKYNGFLNYVFHFAYKKAGKIYYKKAEFGFDFNLGLYFRYPSTPLEISVGDANTARHTPDISLRNGLPIVTYQGILPMTRVYSIEEVGSSPESPQTHTVQFTQYPIMVTYLKPDLTGWSNPTAQPSSGTIVQSDPNIEGSTTGNGYILSFRKGNSGYYQYSNLQNYHCDPPAFLGTDAKLVRGSYTTPLGGALLTTLISENSLYKLGKQDVAVTNVNSQVQDGVYGNIKGVVNMNDIDYVFNMGPIFVATGPQVDMPLFGDALNEVTPVSGIEFNEYLRSEPFALNNGDTLILGATANYIAVNKQDFYPLKYTVNLMNANTQEVSRVLFSDTIHIEDEEMTEYYRGFVFSDLNPEDGNVYLQIMVEDVSNADTKYNYVGIYQGESEVSDRSGRIDPTHGVFVDFGHGRNPSNVLTVKPTSYSLAQNYPNPFNPTTTIRYSLPNDGLVQIKIYDLSGKEVMNLVNENKVAGNYEVKFNGANLSSGVYFYRINTGEFVQTKRMVLVK